MEPSQMQRLLDFGEGRFRLAPKCRSQLLKWIGNKQRFAPEIVSFFPARFGTYIEPFLGSAAVLATLAPRRAIGSDVFQPLVEIWQTLRSDPARLNHWYSGRWHSVANGEKIAEYEKIKASYNKSPNAADLLFLCRSCYGGVVRFRKADGYMSTPCGIHRPINPESFARRVEEWQKRTAGTEFRVMDYRAAMAAAKSGDVVYCDPPYRDSQTILYGAQAFDLRELFDAIRDCRSRGVYVVLSIDGTKRSGTTLCDVSIPDDLFEREVFVNCGRSMLRRFQLGGQTLEAEVVADRLLLTY
jgi:DNA adenine methylase